MISFLRRLRKISVERCEQRFFPLRDWNVLEWAGATAGECGEMANVAKKMRRHEIVSRQKNTLWHKEEYTARYNNKQDKLRQQLADEVADTVIYLDLLCASQGIDLQEAIIKKFNETSKKIGFKEKLQ